MNSNTTTTFTLGLLVLSGCATFQDQRSDSDSTGYDFSDLSIVEHVESKALDMAALYLENGKRFPYYLDFLEEFFREAELEGVEVSQDAAGRIAKCYILINEPIPPYLDRLVGKVFIEENTYLDSAQAPGKFTLRDSDDLRSAHLTWEDRSNNELFFYVLRNDNDGENSKYRVVKLLDAGTTEWTDTGLDPDKIYFYTVGSCNNLDPSF